MIIRLTKANFSSNNIGQYTTEPGTLTFNVSPSNASWTLTCAAMSPSTKTGTGNTTWANIPAGSTVSYEVSLSGYNTQKGSISIYGNTSKTITLSEVGSVTPPVTPEEPTMYTFTINPTPTNAIVTLTAPGHSQSGKSITVPANTSVSWKVTASGYTEQKGTHTVTKTETKNVTLSAVSSGNTTQIDLGTINDNKWIKFENGEDQSLNAWRSTADYIAIPDGVTSIHSDDITAYRNDGANTTPYAFYDVDKNYISGVDMETIPVGTTGVAGVGAWRNSLTYDVPENAAYVRICWTAEKYKHMTTGVNTSITSPIVQWVY